MESQMQVMDPEEKELREEIKANGLIAVVDAESYQAAGERWKALIALEKRIKEKFDPSVDAANEAANKARALRALFLDPVTEAKKAQPVEMKRWQQEEERKRLALEREAQERARKQAEDDALATAAALEKEGFKETAETILNNPPQAPVVIQPKTVPKGFGGAIRTTWKVQVVDLSALVKAVSSGAVPMGAIQANETFLGQMARSLKAEMKYAGVRVWQE